MTDGNTDRERMDERYEAREAAQRAEMAADDMEDLAHELAVALRGVSEYELSDRPCWSLRCTTDQHTGECSAATEALKKWNNRHG